MVEDKVRWLGYHDKDCVSLPGWLPLANGMPVALADHLEAASAGAHSNYRWMGVARGRGPVRLRRG
eukprot:9067058-Pyramimonas_sp.AAC.1